MILDAPLSKNQSSDFNPEISCRAMACIFMYCEDRFGVERVERALMRADSKVPLAFFHDLKNFISWEFSLRIIQALSDEFSQDDPEFLRKAGESVATPKAAGFLYYLLKAFASPRAAYEKIVSISPTYNNVGKLSIDSISNHHIILRYHSLRPEPNRQVCELRLAQYASIPSIWNLKSNAKELQCQVLGDSACVYSISWISSVKRAIPVVVSFFLGLLVAVWSHKFAADPLFSIVMGAGISFFSAAAMLFRTQMLYKKELLEEQSNSQVDALHDLQVQFGKIQELNETLEKKVNERTHELVIAKEKLSASLDQAVELDRAKTTFFSNISHEFRTPLTLLLAPVEDLLSQSLKPAQIEQLSLARRNAIRLLLLVNNLLDFTKIEAHRLEMNEDPIYISSYTSDLASMFRSSIEKAGIKFSVACDFPSKLVMMDREIWQKIVVNLISNALKFTFQGEIAIFLKAMGDQLQLKVRDTGTGIDENERKRIFERFYRVQKTRARVEEGTGIGLALVQELVSLLGGTIDVESAIGRGSTFTVRVPLKNPPVGMQTENAPFRPRETLVAEYSLFHSAVPPSIQQHGHRTGTILVVDDNEDMRNYLGKVLNEKFDIALASTGLDALRVIENKIPDIILSDVMMPELDGIGLLRELRSRPATSSIPVILISARADEGVAVESLSQGADDYIYKPFSAKELLARITTHYELAQARKYSTQIELKESFLGLAAHELRTPLTPLKLFVQLLKKSLISSELAESVEIGKFFQEIEKSTTRLEHLTELTLSTLSLQADKVQLGFSNANLSDVCVQAVREHSLSSTREVILDLPEIAILVYIDELRISQILDCFLSNAVKFSRPDTKVILSLKVLNEEAIICVTDQGPGIPAEFMSRLFEKFFCVPGVEVQSGSKVGFGLGLFFSKKIIELHKGRIWVDSTVSKGSSFCIALPLQRT